MKSSVIIAAVASFASSALAVQFTNSKYDIAVGKPITLTWSDQSGDVSIILEHGATASPDGFKDLKVLTSGVKGSSYTWTPTADDLGKDGFYALKIKDSAGENFSPSFAGAGGSSVSTSASASATASATESKTTMTKTTSSDGTTTTASQTSSASKESATESKTSSSASKTQSSGTTATTGQSSTGSAASATTTPKNTNDSARYKASLALALGAVAAFAWFN